MSCLPPKFQHSLRHIHSMLSDSVNTPPPHGHALQWSPGGYMPEWNPFILESTPHHTPTDTPSGALTHPFNTPEGPYISNLLNVYPNEDLPTQHLQTVDALSVALVPDAEPHPHLPSIQKQSPDAPEGSLIRCGHPDCTYSPNKNNQWKPRMNDRCDLARTVCRVKFHYIKEHGWNLGGPELAPRLEVDHFPARFKDALDSTKSKHDRAFFDQMTQDSVL